MPPEREMNPHANDNSENSRRFTIAADADESTVEIRLPAQLPNGRQPSAYSIVKKDIPDAAKGKTYGKVNGEDAVVKWINCFGIRLRGNFDVIGGGKKDNPFIEEVSGERFSYEVVVPVRSRPTGYQTLVYFDGTDVQPARNVTTDLNGDYHYNLNIGDPPQGWGG